MRRTSLAMTKLAVTKQSLNLINQRASLSVKINSKIDFHVVLQSHRVTDSSRFQLGIRGVLRVQTWNLQL